MRRQLILNTASSWGYRLLKVALAIFTGPVLIRELGKAGYGVLILFTALLSFTELADLGLRPALGRELAEARGRGDTVRFNTLFSTALLVYAGLFVAFAFLLLVFGGWFISAYAPAQMDVGALRILFIPYGIFSLMLAFARPAFSAVLASANRFDLRNGIETIYTLVAGVGILLALGVWHTGLSGWVAVQVVALLGNMAMLVAAARRAAPGLAFRPGRASRAETAQLYGLGSALFLGQWAKKIKFDADPFVISSFLSAGVLAAYKPPASLMANVRPLLAAFAGQLYPLTTGMAARGEQAQVRRLFLAASRYTVLMAVPVLVGMAIYGEDIMQLWLGRVLGPADTHLAGQVLAGWGAIEFCVALEGASWAVLLGQKKVRFVTVVDICAALANILASILLIRYTNLGVMGVVWPTIVLEGLVRPLYAWRAGASCGATLPEIVRHIWAPSIWIALLLASAAFCLRSVLSSTGWLLGAHVALLGAAYLLLGYGIGLEPAERKIIGGWISKKRG